MPSDLDIARELARKALIEYKNALVQVAILEIEIEASRKLKELEDTDYSSIDLSTELDEAVAEFKKVMNKKRGVYTNE